MSAALELVIAFPRSWSRPVGARGVATLDVKYGSWKWSEITENLAILKPEGMTL